MTIATELARRIRAFTYDGLPEAAVEWAKMGILDTVGVTLLTVTEEGKTDWPETLWATIVRICAV